MTIEEKLTLIAQNEQNVYNAGYEKGKTAGSGGDTLKTLLDATKTTKNLFADSTITTAEGLIPYSATENVTSMYQMFYQSKLLTTIPLFDTSNATNMQNMFYFCYALTTVPLFDTRKVTNMRNMFYQCNALTTVPLFDTSNVTDMQGMFQNCYALKKVVLGKISSKVTNTSNWFYDCKALEIIHFKDATSVPTLSSTNAFKGVPSTCKVVIPDALYDTWTNKTNWSAINVTWVKESEYTEE